MRVRLNKSAIALPIDIANLEAHFAVSVPESYKQFVRTYDGAVPETNIFGVGTGNESGVNRFIRVRDIAHEAKNIENLGDKMFPVAWAEGGNYVLLDLSEGTDVVFWDHENPTKLILLSSDFESFLSLLEPFDVSSIKLKPGQIESAWIDPDFLKGLNK